MLVDTCLFKNIYIFGALVLFETNSNPKIHSVMNKSTCKFDVLWFFERPSLSKLPRRICFLLQCRNLNQSLSSWLCVHVLLGPEHLALSVLDGCPVTELHPSPAIVLLSLTAIKFMYRELSI